MLLKLPTTVVFRWLAAKQEKMEIGKRPQKWQDESKHRYSYTITRHSIGPSLTHTTGSVASRIRRPHGQVLSDNPSFAVRKMYVPQHVLHILTQ
jgi:hypothetical protein